MDALKLSVINVVSWIIGSGLIVFTINTIYVDFIKQPDIAFQVDEVDRNSSSISMEIFAGNFGMIPAHDITLAIETYDLEIIKYHPFYYEEDIGNVKSVIENPNKLTIKIPRLSNVGDGLQQEVTVAFPSKGVDDPNTDIEISAKYEEGSHAAYYYVDKYNIEQAATMGDSDILWKNVVFHYLVIIIVPIIARLYWLFQKSTEK